MKGFFLAGYAQFFFVGFFFALLVLSVAEQKWVSVWMSAVMLALNLALGILNARKAGALR